MAVSDPPRPTEQPSSQAPVSPWPFPLRQEVKSHAQISSRAGLQPSPHTLFAPVNSSHATPADGLGIEGFSGTRSRETRFSEINMYGFTLSLPP